MGFDFHGIRRRLRYRVDRIYWHAVDVKERIARRTIRILAEDIGADAAELDALERKHDNDIELLNERLLFTAVGQALSAWAQMEESLVAIVGMLLGARFTKAGVMMYSIINFNVWLSIIDELFSLEPRYATLKPKWNKINERLKRVKDVRDRLAHHTIHSGGPRAITFAGGAALNPGRFDTRKKSQKYEPLDYNQVSDFVNSIASIVGDLTRLINSMTELVEHEPLPQKSSQPDSDQNPPSDAQ